MASLIATNSVFTTRLRLTSKTTQQFRPLNFFPSPDVRLIGGLNRRNTRGLVVITRAGLTMTNYIFAFVFPLSLLAMTIFTSIKIADKLDKDFLEELAVNEAIMESEGGDEDTPISVEEEPALPRTRNRPKREA